MKYEWSLHLQPLDNFGLNFKELVAVKFLPFLTCVSFEFSQFSCFLIVRISEHNFGHPFAINVVS